MTVNQEIAPLRIVRFELLTLSKFNKQKPTRYNYSKSDKWVKNTEKDWSGQN